jgi:hypothetical protein
VGHREGGGRFLAIEEVLVRLDKTAVEWDADLMLAPCALLLRRAVADIETGLEGALSGYLGVLADAMRDMMETELIILDFAASPERIKLWVEADDRTLLREFKPVRLRERLEAAGTGAFASPEQRQDYKAHSSTLHPSPRGDALVPRGAGGRGALGPDAEWLEILVHSRRLLDAADRLLRAVTGKPAGDPTPLPRLATAMEHSRTTEGIGNATWTRLQETLAKDARSGAIEARTVEVSIEADLEKILS